MNSFPLLDVRDLKVYYPVREGLLMRRRGCIQAVDGVSLSIGCGETLGLVGESGCGKSTLAKAVVRLLKPTAGSIHFDGKVITALRGGELKSYRRDLQMVFQDPAESLNPRMSVRSIIEEPLIIHRIGSRKERRVWVNKLLDRVGLSSHAADKFSYEFSGGQRQRIGIARALALKPKFIVCDEPVSALDVSVQSQILNLLVDLQRDMGLSYLFIAHDLSVVKHMSDRVAVMYLGKIVELASAEQIYKNPKHAYTKALLRAIPTTDFREKVKGVILEGDVPSPYNPPKGSAFGHRIKHAMYEQTIGMDLSLKEITAGHYVAADPCALDAGDWESLQR